MTKDENTQDVELDETKNNDVQDDQNDSHEQSPDESKSNDDDKDWKAEALKYKAILDRNKDKKPESKSKKSEGLDYGQKAFLVANGIKGEDEIGLVEDAMKKTGDSLEGVMENPYFKAQLENVRELAKTKDAMPKDTKLGGVPTDSVEYWMSKPIEEVPSEMRIKVVNEKLRQSQSKGVFYNS